MYTYEKAIRDTGLQFNTADHGAVGSAFRALERRGAPDSAWQTVIDRIRRSAGGASTDDYTVPDPDLDALARLRAIVLS